MPVKTVTVGVIIGSTLMALLLTGSSRNAASPSQQKSPGSPELVRLKTRGVTLYNEGRYLEAREMFRAAAALAEKEKNYKVAVGNRINGGICSELLLQFREALVELTDAKEQALNFGQTVLLETALNSIAALYIRIGQPEKALQIARDALPMAEKTDRSLHAFLLYQNAFATAELGQVEESIPLFLQCLNEFLDLGDVGNAIAALGTLGRKSLEKQRTDLAEWTFHEGFRLARTHKVFLSASILVGLAKVRHLRGDDHSAAILFDSAVASPPRFTPRFGVLADRGEFRSKTGDIRGGFADYAESRKMAAEMRTDIVPADQDRVALESGLSQVLEGYIDSGNRLWMQTGDRSLLEETFDAAEQDRLWSLRALIPEANDWRTRLPSHYWDVLARYQSLVRSAPAPASDAGKKANALRQELQRMETDAGGKPTESNAETPLAHIRNILDDDTVLLSFHASKISAWLWAVDRSRMEAVRLCPTQQIELEVSALRRALQDGDGAAANEQGHKLYRDLFGHVPETFLARRHWLLELDGPLYELPFAALVTNQGAEPAYLIEHADIRIIPGALLAQRGSIPADAGFLGIGDPVYSPADERYRGTRFHSGQSLPRLPNTAPELEACIRAWGRPAGSRLLTGPDARIVPVRAALKTNPAILHFATHIVAQKDEFQSGVIALSLDSDGVMGLLGPREIVARGVRPKLVVMNGCHSAQGQALPGAGLMGLTRAWIGAGAMAVLATQWDIPDDAAQSLMTDFYRSLHAAPEQGAAAALQTAQRKALLSPSARRLPGSWAGYFLLSRTL